MPMSDDDFEKHLNTLGLQSTPMSFEETSPVMAGDDVVGTQTGEGVELEATPQQTMLPDAEHSSPQEATVASTTSEPETMEPSSTPGSSSPAPQAKPDVSSVIKNPVVADYMANRMAQQPDDLQQKLADAQTIANRQRFIANLGSAFNDLAHAPSTQRPDNSFYENLLNNADSGVKSVLAQQKAGQDQVLGNINKSKLQQLMEDNQTDGPAARAALAVNTPMAIKAGIDPKLLEGLSPRQQKEFLEKPLEQQARLQSLEVQKQYINAMRQNSLDVRKQALDALNSERNKQMQDKVGKELYSLDKRTQTALGQAGSSIASADRALKILGNQTVTNQDAASLAQDINNMISGKVSVTGAHEQQYNTLKSKLASTYQSLSGNPEDAVPPGIKNHLVGLVKEMRDISSNVVKQNSKTVEAAHPDFAESNPGYFENVAKAMALDLPENTPSGTATVQAPIKQAVTTLGPATSMAQPQAGSAPSTTPPKLTPPQGKVHVMNSKGEQYYIDPSDLTDAQKEGFARVQ